MPERSVLQVWATQIDQYIHWDKPIVEYDLIEAKALLFQLMKRRLDMLEERLTPAMQELERMVREIETVGFEVKITRTEEETGPSFVARVLPRKSQVP